MNCAKAQSAHRSRSIICSFLQSDTEDIFRLPEDTKRHWNVIKFTCGLLVDSSLLLERICEKFVDILTTMTLDTEHEKSFMFLYNHGYLRDLDRERSSISCDPYSNRIICCMNSRSSLMRRNCQLYYFYGGDVFEYYVNCVGTSLLRELRSSVNGSVKPCSIVIRETDSPLFLRSALRAWSEIEQPIKYLIVEGSEMNAIVQEMYVPHTKMYQEQDFLPMLSLHNEAIVRFSHCNFGSDNLKYIVDSLSCDTSLGTLELLYCRKIPEALISCLIFKQNLICLVIRKYHGRGFSPDVQEKLQQRIRFLRKLEHLEIHRMHLDPSLLRTSSLRVVSLRDCSLSRVDALILIEILVKCPLERLELDNNEIPETFEVLSRKPNVTYPHLEILFLRRVDLTREDIQGIARMINQGKLPAIQRILLDEPPVVHRELRDHLDVYNPQNTRGSFEETEKFVYRKLLFPCLQDLAENFYL